MKVKYLIAVICSISLASLEAEGENPDGTKPGIEALLKDETYVINKDAEGACYSIDIVSVPDRIGALLINKLSCISQVSFVEKSSVSREFLDALRRCDHVSVLRVHRSQEEENIAALDKFPNVKTVEFDGVSLTGETLPIWKTIEILNADSSDFSDKGISKIVAMRTLTELSFSADKSSISVISKLANLPHLTKLVITVSDPKKEAELRRIFSNNESLYFEAVPRSLE